MKIRPGYLVEITPKNGKRVVVGRILPPPKDSPQTDLLYTEIFYHDGGRGGTGFFSESEEMKLLELPLSEVAQKTLINLAAISLSKLDECDSKIKRVREAIS